MRVRPQQVRALAGIAMQRLQERELRALHETISQLSALAFVELVRDIEDEIESAIAVGFSVDREREFPGSDFSSLYSELEVIRKRDLKLPVYRFAELLSETLRNDPEIERNGVPTFDSRRGLEFWIKRLSSKYSEQQIYRAIMELRKHRSGKDGESAWKLR